MYPPVEGAVGAAARGLEGSDATLVVGATTPVGIVNPPPVVGTLADGGLAADVVPASGGIANAGGGDVGGGELGATLAGGTEANCDGAAETGSTEAVVAGGAVLPVNG